ETIARTITDPHYQAQALAALVEALAGAGQHEQAETIARTITDPHYQAQALAALVEALAGAGQHEQAETIARTITDPHYQAQAIASIVRHNNVSQNRQLLAWGLSRLSHVYLLNSVVKVEPAAVCRLAQAIEQADHKPR
ncbi:hypothetical protein ACFV0L_44130, partial [Streptosporangium canum]|uniref:hypothetical protein n=1 Tax=Streptosporangium canum TaxID=324952 RepID=UPI0036AF0E3A